MYGYDFFLNSMHFFFKRTLLLILLLFLLTNKTSIIDAQSYQRSLTVVFNFAQMNELDWSASEDTWQKDVKPQIVRQIEQMRQTFADSRGNNSDTYPVLAWSTLMEYMNFPLDTPTSSSPYVVKTRRILELAQELNFPVFLPLNGFQWWDELPELYNWWDPDGTHTDPKFFSRQDNPDDFTKRFIAGYNPNNIYNVEWQSFKTPMKLNYRNWGGGGFRLAPPPNLMPHTRTSRTYRSVQAQRLKAITNEIAQTYARWEKEDKAYLFAGITIGTEVSLNASVTPRDEFEPYGYRAVTDLICEDASSTCSASLTKQEIATGRKEVVQQYLEDTARLAVNAGIPKHSIYTHVWSEATPDDARYANYIDAAFNLYSNPGISLYGYAVQPLLLPDLQKALTKYGNPDWGAVEYSAGTKANDWNNGLKNTFTNSQAQASVMVIYNWNEHKDTGAISAIRSFLSQKKSDRCTPPVLIPETKNYADNPLALTWRNDDSSSTKTYETILHIQRGVRANLTQTDLITKTLPVGTVNTELSSIPVGVYTWYVETVGCLEQKRVYSEPRIFTIRYTPPQDTTPSWVRWILERS